MATFTTPVPPPVKNDWLSSGLDNPRLSPPSPGGPRKAAPQQQVRYLPIKVTRWKIVLCLKNGWNDVSLMFRDRSVPWVVHLPGEVRHLHRPVQGRLRQYRIVRVVELPHRCQVVDQVAKPYRRPWFHREYSQFILYLFLFYCPLPSFLFPPSRW